MDWLVNWEDGSECLAERVFAATPVQAARQYILRATLSSQSDGSETQYTGAHRVLVRKINKCGTVRKRGEVVIVDLVVRIEVSL